MSHAGLYVVATPIGNLEDISYRATRLLSAADLIAAEDTRHSHVLLAHYGITTPTMAFHEHNETRVMGRILDRIASGQTVALISDAGTPLISDPGYRLVLAAREAGLPVFALPGPSAVTAALSVAGLPPDRFIFEGFLSAKAVARRTRLEELSCETRTMVFFESSHRIKATVDAMTEVFERGRLAAVCRELTKKFETEIRAPLSEISVRLALDKNQKKGEFVIVVDGFKGSQNESISSALRTASALLAYLPASQAARVAAKLHDVPRREVYRLLDQ